MAAGTATTGRYVKTDIPARLDRLPWSRWHWTIVFALGITWVLDGLEVTIVGTIGSRLTEADTLHFSAGQVGAIASFYIAGAVVGAIVFGYFTDKLGRKKLLLVTLGWYATFTVENAFAWNFWSFAIFRFLAANGIGGEYAAINSAIDELIPAERRGQVDLSINSSWWIGTMLASALSSAPAGRAAVSSQSGLAALLLPRRCDRARRALRTALGTGESALAHDPRADRAGRKDRQTDRTRGGAKQRPAATAHRYRRDRGHGEACRLCRDRDNDDSHLSVADLPWPQPNGYSGFSVQRSLLHRGAGADRVFSRCRVEAWGCTSFRWQWGTCSVRGSWGDFSTQSGGSR